MNAWKSAAGKQLRDEYRQACVEAFAPCWLCGQPIPYDASHGHPLAFQADHYWPQKLRPDLALEWGNLRPSHATCNQARQQKHPPQPRPPLGPRGANW